MMCQGEVFYRNNTWQRGIIRREDCHVNMLSEGKFQPKRKRRELYFLRSGLCFEEEIRDLKREREFVSFVKMESPATKYHGCFADSVR